MGFTADDIRANRDYFAQKLRAEKQRNDVLRAVESGNVDFILLDTRERDQFVQGHIPGAVCAPIGELQQLVAVLPENVEIVTYCSGHD